MRNKLWGVLLALILCSSAFAQWSQVGFQQAGTGYWFVYGDLESDNPTWCEDVVDEYGCVSFYFWQYNYGEPFATFVHWHWWEHWDYFIEPL